MSRFTLLVLAVAFLVGCSGTEVRDHAVVAREVQEKILELQEAMHNGAAQTELDRRFRLLIEEMDVLIDSAENYDDIMDRFRVLYDEFDEVSRMETRSTSEGDTFFQDRGVPIDSRLERAASERRTTSPPPNRRETQTPQADVPLEPTNAELRAAAERNVSEQLAGIIARAELADRRLDALDDPGKEDSDE